VFFFLFICLFDNSLSHLNELEQKCNEEHNIKSILCFFFGEGLKLRKNDKMVWTRIELRTDKFERVAISAKTVFSFSHLNVRKMNLPIHKYNLILGVHCCSQSRLKKTKAVLNHTGQQQHSPTKNRSFSFRKLNSTFFIDFQLLITTPYLVFSQLVRFLR
jgi:hypothetical protein